MAALPLTVGGCPHEGTHLSFLKMAVATPVNSDSESELNNTCKQSSSSDAFSGVGVADGPAFSRWVLFTEAASAAGSSPPLFWMSPKGAAGTTGVVEAGTAATEAARG